MTDKHRRPIFDKNGKPIETREYYFKRTDGTTVVIQDHSAGHNFGDGVNGNQGPHFNVRPIDLETGKASRNRVFPGTLDHYSF